MEHFSASTFHNISKLIQTAYCHYRRSQKSGLLQVPGRAISDNEKTDLWRMYDEIEGHCKEIRLLASVQCAKRLKQEFANSAVDADGKILVYPVQAAIDASHAAYRIEELDNRIIEEMQTRLFLQILPHRLKFFTDIERMYPGEMEQLASLLGEEVYGLSKQLSNFQNTSFDLFEAGNCFACERYTACVHHLSKVVEFGLVALAAYAGVEEKDRRNWNTALNVAHANLRSKVGNFANLSKADEQYFSEAIGLLRNFNIAWRNPVSHIPRRYEEKQAKDLFTVAKSTMGHLNLRLSEVSMDDS